MLDVNGSSGFSERLIDAAEAAWLLNLPRYWLTHPKERRKRAIPHYRIGKLVRFKCSELESWLTAHGAIHAGLQ